MSRKGRYALAEKIGEFSVKKSSQHRSLEEKIGWDD